MQQMVTRDMLAYSSGVCPGAYSTTDLHGCLKVRLKGRPARLEMLLVELIRPPRLLRQVGREAAPVAAATGVAVSGPRRGGDVYP